MNSISFLSKLSHSDKACGSARSYLSTNACWSTYNRKKPFSAKDDLLLKSIGYAKGYRRVWDATCGLAEDAVYLAQQGCQVLAFEKSMIVYQLLNEALLELRKSSENELWGHRLQIVYQDFMTFEKKNLPQDSPQDPSQGPSQDPSQDQWAPPEIVYLDPMFPEVGKKTALPKKETLWLRQVTGGNSSLAEMNSIAEQMVLRGLQWATARVVLKRPLKAPLIKPSLCVHSFRGKAVRYDLYLVRAGQKISVQT